MDGRVEIDAPYGSSPLARGLLRGRRHRHPDRRIIPARAGFTDPLLARHPSRRDHPRSRGVYVRVAVGGHVLGGIIPARAGFTAPVRHRADDRQDHPRSRGVYLVQTVSLTVDRWIIPARAGFTPRGRVRGRGRPDHPRSRGVYPSGSYASMMRDGSSPLARGLPPTGPPGRAGRGIIPARAGFTRGPSRRPATARDHPRSRGVYRTSKGRSMSMSGSSPLARGLPPRLRGDRRDCRIIPARAGFTRSRGRWKAARADHPRSRGVYGASGGLVLTFRGSSPLARGLHATTASLSAKTRIIPARAGFTHLVRLHGRRGADHPRSRGVYSRSWWIANCGCGSSPLARGLP